jgi:alkanesulfonate monooxygenase SsuD/methylene tetrahydromethanopterin reductase-like flavin-dependent oxidoreductase (luciferase family)
MDGDRTGETAWAHETARARTVVVTSGDAPQFFLFLPQMRMDLAAIEERAVVAERSGFHGIAFMDHLAPPMADSQPMYEAMTLATLIAARTQHLVVSHLVLCDALRHPAVLARQAVTLDHLSGGRFELGIGAGSVPAELVTYGVTHDGPGARVTRLGESLELLEALWSGEAVSFTGEHFQVDCPGQSPVPLGTIPIVIGGGRPRMLSLVRRHARWWNLQLNLLDQLERLRPDAGDARVSIQQMVAFVSDEHRRAEVEATAARRFGMMGGGLVTGDADQLVDHFASLQQRGVERFYVWFADFAAIETLEAFGEGVIAVA